MTNTETAKFTKAKNLTLAAGTALVPSSAMAFGAISAGPGGLTLFRVATVLIAAAAIGLVYDALEKKTEGKSDSRVENAFSMLTAMAAGLCTTSGFITIGHAAAGISPGTAMVATAAVALGSAAAAILVLRAGEPTRNNMLTRQTVGGGTALFSLTCSTMSAGWTTLAEIGWILALIYLITGATIWWWTREEAEAVNGANGNHA